MARKVFRGYIVMKLTTAATTGHTANTEIAIPGMAYPRNPLNRVRPGVVNSTGEPSIEALGKRTPTIRVVAFPKTSWLTPNFINSLILGLTAGGDTGAWGIVLNDGTSNRVYDGCRCERLILTGNPVCGPIIMDFKAIYGDSEAAVPTTVSTPSVDNGQVIKASECQWTSATADNVREWGVVLERDQAWDMVADGTLYATAIRSGPLRGALTLGQDPDASNSPSSGDTSSGTPVIKIGPSGGGIQLTLKVSNDEDETPHIPSIVTRTRSYGLIDLSDGAGMVAVAAVP